MAYELTPEQLKEIKRVFEIYKHKDYILKDNLVSALKDLNLSIKNENEELELLQSISEFQNITLIVFVKITSELYRKIDFAIQLEDAFKAYATEGGDYISFGKLKEAITQSGPKIKEEEADELLRTLEFDGDRFNFKEFIDKEV